MKRFLALAALVLAAGCVSPADPVDAASAPAPPAPAPAAPVVLVEAGRMPNQALEFDVLCTQGGGHELERVQGALVLPGVTTLTVTVAPSPASSGFQVGHALDEGDVTWLPVAPPGTASTFTIDVPPDAHEADGTRWTFWGQHNVYSAPQDCYTGGGFGGWTVRIETA